MPTRNPRLLAALLSLLILLLGCQTEDPALLGPEGSGGISFSAPVVGAQETYVQYRYGTSRGDGDTAKTYEKGRLTLMVLAVDQGTVALRETRCFEWDTTCRVQDLKLDRKTGKFQAVGEPGWAELMAANAFPSGIFSEDPKHTMVFDGHAPRAEGPTVGVAAEFRAGNRTYRTVTVMADPTDIPVDAGGKCLVLTRDDRLIEIRHYHVFGIDGGWELRE